MKVSTFGILCFTALFVKAQQSINMTGPAIPVFQENKGQISDQFFKTRSDILFAGRSGEMMYYLRSNGVSYQMRQVNSWEERRTPFHGGKLDKVYTMPSSSTVYRLDVDWLNASSPIQIEQGESLSGTDNFYLSSCPMGAVDVKSYEMVTYKDVYPGVNVKWYQAEGQLKYDFQVAAGADYKAIQLAYRGAQDLFVNPKGDLVVETPLGTIKEPAPLVLQNGKQLTASWKVEGEIVSFDIKNVNPELSLVIDPLVRLWATYYGGPDSDYPSYMHTDALGNLFMMGATMSQSNIATSGAHQTTLSAPFTKTDAFIVKFNSAGVRQWSTYYGGEDDDWGAKSVTDASGNVYWTGTSSSTAAIATSGAHQTVYGGFGDAYLVKFNSSGLRLWGTYYGGEENEYTYGVAINGAGDVYITGSSTSTAAIATSGAYQTTLAGVQDGFVAKFNSSGVRLWGTYYGGPGIEYFGDCVSNSVGDVYTGGTTTSTLNMATTGAHQTVYGGGTSSSGGDGFIVKFDASGNVLWGTYYGGAGSDVCSDMVLDPSGNLYIAGNCTSTTGTVIATAGAFQTTFGGGGKDAFLVKFNPSGVRQWATLYGANGPELGITPAADPFGNVYLWCQAAISTGSVLSTSCSYQPQYAGGSSDGILVKFDSNGQRLWCTYYGSTFTDDINHCVADINGAVYVNGVTLASSGTVMATANGHQPNYGGGPSDAFLAKFDGCTPGASNTTPAANLMVCSGKSTTLSATCSHWYSIPTSNAPISTGSVLIVGPIVSDTTFYVEDFGCGISASLAPIQVSLAPEPSVSITTEPDPVCMYQVAILTASGASSYTWNASPVVSPTLQIMPTVITVYTIAATNSYGCRATFTYELIPALCEGISENVAFMNLVSVFPNPSQDAVTIKSTAAADLILLNSLGAKLKSIQLTPSNNFSTTIGDLPAGVYFLGRSGEGTGTCKKIVVIR